MDHSVKKVGQAARVLVVTGHIDGGDGSLEIGFMLGGGRFRGFLDCGQVLAGGSGSLETGRAEKDDRVLNLLAAKTGKRFLIFGKDAEDASVGTAQKRFVLVSQRCGVELVGHRKTHVLKPLSQAGLGIGRPHYARR